jgi:arylsulfatase
MVVRWPEGIKAKGEIRPQFGHVIDIAPTIYEITGIPAPKVVNGITQDPIEGTSLAYTFTDAGAPERHKVQYFEMFGNRAIYKDGWFARTIHKMPWQIKPLNTLQEDVWDLYNTKEDFSLAKNLASQYPDKLKDLEDQFMKEAEKYHVLPIDDRSIERTDAKIAGRPTVMEGRTSLTLGEGMKGMGIDIFLSLRNTSYSITTDFEVESKGNGVIVCQGGRFGGFSLYLKDGRPEFTYNYLGMKSYTIASSQPLKPGKHIMVYDFKWDGGKPGAGGSGSITVDGNKVAEGRIDITQPGIFSVDDLADVGIDEGTPVADYGASSKFNGKLGKVTIDLKK